MEATIYYINCLTNLHVGSGDVNFNTVDNEVERDLSRLSHHPLSGVKGPLRQFFVEMAGAYDQIIWVFCSEKQNKPKARQPEDSDCTDAGSPCANITGSAAYYMVTTKLALEQLCNIGGGGLRFPF